jgi:hypothetical protein
MVVGPIRQREEDQHFPLFLNGFVIPDLSYYSYAHVRLFTRSPVRAQPQVVMGYAQVIHWLKLREETGLVVATRICF